MKRASFTVSVLAQRCEMSEAEALEALENFERKGYVRRRGDLWIVSERALRPYYLGRERAAS